MKPAGLSTTSREQLGKLLRGSHPIITPAGAAQLLGLAPAVAARRLAAWSRAGWLARVRRGAYVPVPIEAASADIALDDAWVVVSEVFSPCYIGGWSAAEHWGLTEQIFRSTCVMTVQRPRNRRPVLRKARFELHTVPEAYFVGMKSVWRGGTRIQVSDPARTLVDMLADPRLGGGIRHVGEMLAAFLRDRSGDSAKLGVHAVKLGIGSVFKRLGFLLQRDHADQVELMHLCREHLSAGYAKLDPALPADRLATSWRVWVPDSESRRKLP